MDLRSRSLAGTHPSRFLGEVRVPADVGRDLEVYLPHSAYDVTSPSYSSLANFRETADEALARDPMVLRVARLFSITVRFFK